MSKDPRIDAYIERAQPFAKPILEQVRALTHKYCPGIEEAMKWSSPSFLYKGKIMCGMSAFKEHAAFGFWYGEMVTGAPGIGAMGSFGRLTDVGNLPDEKTLAAMFKKAMQLIDDGVKPSHMEGRGKHRKPAIEMTPAFRAALAASPTARDTFANFPPSAQRDYLEWIVEAKRDETRDKRIAQAVEWIGEGKRRNWKYENC